MYARIGERHLRVLIVPKHSHDDPLPTNHLKPRPVAALQNDDLGQPNRHIFALWTN
jgi:hypothetical protein